MSNIDPRLDFVRKLRPNEQVSLANRTHFMARMGDAAATETAEVRIQVLIQVKDALRALTVPGVYVRSQLGNLLTAQVTPEAIEGLETDPNVIFVERGSPLVTSHTNNTLSDSTKIDLPTGPLEETGKDVIVGIIDYGCDFTHGDFQNNDGSSRLLSFWDQTAQAGPGRRPPFGYNVGVEFSKALIDNALTQADPFAALGIEPPDVRSHGTHVMGITAGNGREAPQMGVRGLAPEADIIFVQLNAEDTDIIGGFGDSVNLAEAVKYIFEKAAALDRPAVVNISLGTNYGPHDGTTLVEQWIDRLLGVPGRAVVMALGNEHQERFVRVHAEGKLKTGETSTLYWRVLPGDATPNEVEIWYSGRDIFVAEVSLPNGETLPIVEPNKTGVFDVGHTGTRVYVSNQLHSPLNGDNPIDIIVFMPEGQQAEAGVWQIRVTSRVSHEGTYDAWIERDERSPINLQSSFIGGSYVRRKTLGSIQSARHTITASNYDALTITLADSTSVGPTRDGRRAPTVAAPGTDILSANARYKQAERPADRTPYFRATGTSMSSPHVAGIVACMLQKNPRLTAPQIKGILAASAKPAPGMNDEWRNDWGHGRVDALDALASTPKAEVKPAPVLKPPRCPLTDFQAEGPFFRDGAPFIDDLYPADSNGPVLLFSGTVRNADCEPLKNALVHVWHADETGGYDNDDPKNPPAPNFFRCRARLHTDGNGAFSFRCVLPANYKPIPDNPWVRVKHIHFKFFAEGYQPLTTEVDLEPDDYLETDFWRKGHGSLLAHLEEVREPGNPKSFFRTSFDFVLNRAYKGGYFDEAVRLGILPR